MNNLNSIIIEGNLTRDPEYHNTPKGTPVCTFSVASNRFYKKNDEQQQEVSFINVETWAKVADSCNQYLHKGRGVRVVGRLKQDRWVGQDGKNRDRLKVVAEHVDFKPVFSKNGEKQSPEEEELPTVAAAETSEIAVPPVAEEDEQDEELLKAV